MKITRNLWSAALPAFLLLGCRPAGPTAGAGAGSGAAVAMQVVAVEARRQPVVEALSLVGDIAANESIEVKPETDGIVQEVLFNEGQPVNAGQLLLRLDETKLQAELVEAEAQLKLSQANFDRAQQLFRDRLISQQEYDQASAIFDVNRAAVDRRRRLAKDARVVAPFEGQTGARAISPGQVVTRNTVLTTLVDLDPVKVEMNVPERFLRQTKVGQKIGFDVTAYPGRRFEGEIYFIAPQLDMRTRTALVKTRIPNPEGLLKPGMVANLQLTLTIRDQAIVVPEVALVNNGNDFFVFVVGPQTNAVLRPVTVGERLPGLAEILTGLADGEQIVVEGHQKIGPGMALLLAPPEKAAAYRKTPGT